MAYVSMGCRILLLGVFALAATKWRGRAERAGFAAMIRATRLVPRRLVGVTAFLVVGVETAVVVVLLAPTAAWIGFALAAVVLAGLTGGTAVLVARGQRVACHCFGRSETVIGPAHVVRNALLTLTAVVGGVGLGPVDLVSAGTLAGVAAGVAGTVLAVGFVDLVSLFSGRATGAGLSSGRNLS